MKTKIIKNLKMCKSNDYSYLFNMDTGNFIRYGKTLDDDPQYSHYGPEILDLEISVDGCKNNCNFCYKSNSNNTPTNMTFETFKTIIDKMPIVLTQIAFGITGIQTNPDFIKMLKYCREKQIVPNFTLSGIDLSDKIAKEVVKYIGAVAVSAYETDKNICYNTVKKFTDLGINQTNIHIMVSKQTKDFVYEVLKDSKTDPRLSKLNAIVLLKCKPKGRAKNNFDILNISEYTELVNFCLDNKISFGFDSCTAPDYEIAIENNNKLSDEQKKQMIMLSESCEILSFSSYIDVHGKFYPCSFACGESSDWNDGIDVINCNDFLTDVWFNEKVIKLRNELHSNTYKSGCRKCLMFKEINPIYTI